MLPLLAFLPVETLPILIVVGGMAIMLGLRKLAGTLFTIAGLILFLPVILEPFLMMLPEWALGLAMILFFLSIPALLLRLMIGKNAWEHMVGTLAAAGVLLIIRCFWLGITWPCRGLISLIRNRRI